LGGRCIAATVIGLRSALESVIGSLMASSYPTIVARR